MPILHFLLSTRPGQLVSNGGADGGAGGGAGGGGGGSHEPQVFLQFCFFFCL